MVLKAGRFAAVSPDTVTLDSVLPIIGPRAVTCTEMTVFAELAGCVVVSMGGTTGAVVVVVVGVTTRGAVTTVDGGAGTTSGVARLESSTSRLSRCSTSNRMRLTDIELS